jgi:hypothetical protein
LASGGAAWLPQGGGGDEESGPSWASELTSFAQEKKQKKEMRNGWAATANGLNSAWAARDKYNCFQNFFSTNLNKNSKFKFKSDAFLNSDRFKYFIKTEV